MTDDKSIRLWARAKEGDQAAVVQLLEMYRPLICKLAGRWKVLGWEDAQQEAAVALCKAIEMYDPDRGCYFGVFLKKHVRGHLRTWGRRELRWLERNALYTSGNSVDEDGVRPVEQWADTEPDDRISDVEWDEWMTGLSVRERFVIEENVVKGFRVDEIAKREGVSPHTVRTWKRRALKKLRQRVPHPRDVGALYKDEPPRREKGGQ